MAKAPAKDNQFDQRRESLVDMRNDPGEMVNQAGRAEFESVLQQHRAYLRDHALRHDYRVALNMLADLS